MPLAALDAVLDRKQGGVYFVGDGLDARAVQKAAKARGYAFFHVEGRNIARKEQLLNAIATALDLPPHFGGNWDALEECLSDMDEVAGDGFVLYYEHVDALASAHPAELQTLLEILRDSVESWKADDTPMVVLLSGAKAPKGVARLKATA